MKGTIAALLMLLVAGAVLVVGSGFFDKEAEEVRTAEVVEKAFYQWAVYEGKLEARNVELIMSEFSGSAVIVELAAEGQKVASGDLLVKFDDSILKQDLLRLERDFALARNELESITKAKLPLELRELSFSLLEAQQEYAEKKQSAEQTAQLRIESPDLVSPREVEQDELKARKVQAQMEGLQIKLDLTKNFLHPAAVAQAEATLAAASNSLDIARDQLAKCTIIAPTAGTVVYRPLHMGAEYRTIRVGDSIYKNQVFMALPDLSDIIVQCAVPEAELSLVEVGKASTIVPVAFPSLTLNGRVEKVGSMAQSRPGLADWQKFFSLTIAVSKPDPRLRSGMSVYAQVLSYQNPTAILVPRAAVTWQADQAQVLLDGAAEPKVIQVGRANETHIEVLDGLAAGERVVLP